jgi:mRNA interferase MazF
MKGSIVLIPFPFDDFSSLKVRPAVCLTDPVGVYRHVILAFITSRIPADMVASDIVIATHDPDFVATGLLVTSTIRLHRMMTASTRLIQRELGRLRPDREREVDDKLRKLFLL